MRITTALLQTHIIKICEWSDQVLRYSHIGEACGKLEDILFQ